MKVYSELGEAQLFPDLQVNEKGEFNFDSHGAGFRLQNGEKLNFAVVDPITGDLLSNEFVSKRLILKKHLNKKRIVSLMRNGKYTRLLQVIW